ncbi:MAG: phosphopeptide-binding protein [Bacteroidetes bacterium]|nr:phosphopeptide-binding protein [Bacteroidota bacterium]
MRRLTYLLLLSMTLTWSCKSNSTEKTEETEETETMDHEGHDHSDINTGVVLKAGDLTLTEIISDPFNEAKLSLVSPEANAMVESGSVKFDFKVDSFELGSQTSNAFANHCANSAKGQHIHLILNNLPYTAHYESTFEQEVPDGKYVALAFLSRSYHESIKTPTAYQVFKFNVGEREQELDFDASAPHLFYSRPKGEYVGKDAEMVILDFYLINADLSSDGYKVKAKINGQEVMIDKWAPYMMEGLPMGENTIELTLLDANGAMVISPFNPSIRTVTLKPAEE